MKNNNLNLIDRITSPTPKWFKIIRNVGITLTAVAGVIIASPVALPSVVVTVAGYVLLGGSVASAIAQTAMQSDKNEEKENKEDSKPSENP